MLFAVFEQNLNRRLKFFPVPTFLFIYHRSVFYSQLRAESTVSSRAMFNNIYAQILAHLRLLKPRMFH